MATAQALIIAAYGKSGKNKGTQIATLSSELLDQFNRIVRGYFAIAARLNPVFFADSLAVAFAGGGWAFPSAAECIFRLEHPASTAPGLEVVSVPFDDRAAEPSMPAVYMMGQKFFSAGNALDPVNGSLTFIFSRRPTDCGAVTDAVDAAWPDSFNELLVMDMALYLAIKDGRDADIQQNRTDRDYWLRLYAAHVEHANVTERRRKANIRRFNTNQLIPISDMVTGGGPQL